MSGSDTLDQLDTLAAAVTRARGAALFPALAECLAKALNAAEALVSQKMEAARVRTLAVFAHGGLQPNYEYSLSGTPCAAVLGGAAVHHESGLSGTFPLTAQGYQGYFGAPLTGADGAVLGHLCVHGAASLPVSARQRQWCENLAARAAAELERAQLQALNLYLREEIRGAHNGNAIIGGGTALARVLEGIDRVAPTEAAVLITGETGTGKELIARAIHSASRRSQRPFIKVSWASLSEQPDEDWLDDGRGLLVLASGGTLFFDEIGELTLESQARLLRVLQRQPDVRVISSTNRDLRKAMRGGRFHEDLFSRLNGFSIELPPLRARVDDIPQLVQFFARKYAPRTGRRVDGVDPDTLAALTRYPWPGNIRELENLVERALVLNTSPLLKIPPEMLASYTPDERGDVAAAATGLHRILSPQTYAQANLDDTENTGLHHVQREHIIRVLNATHWVIEGNHGAALKLGMKPATLRHRMKKLGIARAPVAAAHGPGSAPGV